MSLALSIFVLELLTGMEQTNG